MIACIDIGGTHTRVALSEDGKAFSSRVVFDTPQDPKKAMQSIVQAISSLGAKKQPERIVMGVPGALKEDTTVISSPNLPLWHGFCIAGEYERITGIRPQVFNDALLAALGEAVYGAGKNYRRVGYLTVSTGIGGGLVIDKKLQSVSTGFEPGREIIDIEHMKTLEDLASGAGVRRETGKAPVETTDPAFWDHKAEILAVGLWNLVTLWNPEVLIVGGPMVLGNPRIDLDSTIAHLKMIAQGGVKLPIIVPATLGDDRGLLGGLAA